MAEDKKIIIDAGIRHDNLDRDFKAIQEKLRRFQQQQRDFDQQQQNLKRVSVDPNIGKYAKAAFDRNDQEHREGLRKEEEKLRKQIEVAGKQAQATKSTVDALKKEIEAGNLSVKVIEQKKKALEDLMRVEKERTRVVSQSAQDLASVQQALGGMGGGDGGGQGPWTGRSDNYRQFRGMGFGRGTSGFLSRFGGPMAVAGGLAAGIATGAGIAGDVGLSVWNEIAERQRMISMARGAAARTAALPIDRMMEGRGIENQYFAAERARSLGVMQSEMESRRARDITGGVWGGTKRALIGAIPGALMMAGGAVLSATGVGGLLGIPLAGAGLATMAGGAAAGFGTSLTDKGFRGALFNTEEYRAGLTAESIQRAREVEEAQKALNWRKTKGFEFFERNRGTFEEAQQRFGTGNAFEEGGLLRTMLRAGMPMQEAMSTAGAMQSAAGITTGVGDVGDVRRSFLARQAGFTNVDRMTGMMKGLAKGFGEQATEASMKRFFAEAFKAGVDDSKMVEEMRGFANASMQLAASTGMRVEEAAAEIAKGTGGAMSVFGLEAAQSAFQAREQMATAGGANLQRKLAFAQTKRGTELLGKATNVEDLVTFSSMSLEDITADNPQVKDLMEKMGISDINEFKRRKQEFDIRGDITRAGTMKLADELKEETKDMTAEQRRQYLTTGAGAQKYAEFMSRAQIESPTMQRMGWRQRLATTEAIIGTRLGETGQIPGQEITEEEIAGIPEALRRPGLRAGRQLTPGERLQQEMMRRGEELLTTGIKATEAKDQETMMGVFTQPTEAGGRSPFELLSDSARTYDSSASIFRQAVDDFRVLIEKGGAPQDILNQLKDAAVEAERRARNISPSQSPYVMRPGAQSFGFDPSGLDALQQPTAIPGAKKPGE